MNYNKNQSKRKARKLCKRIKYRRYNKCLEIMYHHYTYNHSKVSHFLIKKEDGSLFMRKCNTCGNWKTTRNMKKDKSNKYGVASYCRGCSQKKKKVYKQTHKEKVHQENKRYRERNREKLIKNGREWNKKNKDAVLEQRKKYYANNKEEIFESNRKYRCAKRNAEYEVSGKKAVKTFYEQFGKVCGLTGLPLKEVHIEHLLPLSKGGGNTWSNLYPAESVLNTSKSNLNVFEWIKKKNDINFTFFFKHTLPYLAQYKGLTVDEFIEWYNSTYENHIDQISSQQNTPSNTERLPIQEAFLF